MKRIEELSEKEILNLTQEEIEKMVKLLWANEGVKIIDRPKEPEYSAVPPEDILAYRIDGVNCIFLDINEALKAQSLMRELKSLTDYSYDNFIRIEKDFKSGFPINDFRLYSKALHGEIKELIHENNKAKEAYEVEVAGYESIKGQQDELSSRIYNRVDSVRKKYFKMDRMREIYTNDYLPLAGDREAAMSFLKKAYDINE